MTAKSMPGAGIPHRPDGHRGSRGTATTALGDLTWPEVEQLAADGAVLAVPVGATEQHGPHLPMATDTDVAMALAGRLAARRRDVIVAPPVGYGSSGEHAGFAGTISIGQDALELMLVELGRSAAQTFRHILFLSAHGGNDEPVTRATDRLRAESRDVIAWMPGHHPALVPAEAVGLTPAPDPEISSAAVTGPSSAEDRPDRAITGRSGRGPADRGRPRRDIPADAHAGRVETSIQLSPGPDRVRPGLAEAGNTAPIAELVTVLRTSGVRAVSPNGVLGDPAGASADEGAALLRWLESQLLAVVSRWLQGVPA
jgi:mycofactocin precursor peptide peptidase